MVPGDRDSATLAAVADILLATDADHLYDDIDAAVGGAHNVFRVHEGAHVQQACKQILPELVMLDLQIGNMGGMATSMLLKQEMRMGRLDEAQVMILLDRDADEWLAGKAEADSWLVKPLTSFQIRKAVQLALDPAPLPAADEPAIS